VEYITSLPVKIKLGGRHQKQLLIDAIKNDISREVWDRKKMGFTFPLKKWLSEYSTSDTKTDECPFIDKNEHWSKYWTFVVLKNFFK
jgi:asparagine synthase (glutamine-hydrolysing)